MTAEYANYVIGAGPAGLCAAHELVNHGHSACLLEMEASVGGIARTESYQGFLFDIGGHRFHSNDERVNQLWQQILGSELLTVDRSSCIFFKGRMIGYPLQAAEVFSFLSLKECLSVMASSLKARLTFPASAHNLEDWLINRFGSRLYELFFRSYTEKVWGLPCHEIQADWAPQRIQGLSLWSMLLNALGIAQKNSANLISQFYYPRLGCGMMWEAMAQRITGQGGGLRLRHQVVEVQGDQQGISALLVRNGDAEYSLNAQQAISSIPLPALLHSLRPEPPRQVLQAAKRLKYRSFIMVGLILECSHISADQWIYVHDPGFKVGRMQVFRNWSPHMVPDPERSSLGMEYFCDQDDELWSKNDAELIALATSELNHLFPGLGGKVSQGVVYRIPHAYPVYTLDYKENLQVALDYIQTIPGLHTIGRNGLHRYNNMDHSMLSGIEAARNLMQS